MKSQLFKSEVPIDILQDLLANICEKTNHGEYVVSIESFKKGMYLNLITPFFDNLISYYFDSKKKYVKKQIITYNSFTTVLRQLCNFHHILYTYEVKYCKSIYSIIYKIHIEEKHIEEKKNIEEKTLN
jgi:hypothetical protein